MKTSAFMRAAKSVIQDPLDWCRGWFAKTHRGDYCQATDPCANKWCSIGTLYLTLDKNPTAGDACKEARFFLKNHMEGAIDSFNDNHTHKEVMAAWDAAITEAEQKERESC